MNNIGENVCRNTEHRMIKKMDKISKVRNKTLILKAFNRVTKNTQDLMAQSRIVEVNKILCTISQCAS